MRSFILILATFVWLNILPVQQARAADEPQTSAESFDKHVKPFFTQHCVRCHNVDEMTSGIRVDHLTSAMEDRHLRLWDGIRHQIDLKTMPPKDELQPPDAERQQIVSWITQSLDDARKRPTPKNGGVRRLTVAQYRNTLRELLLLEDNVADVLPPEAVSRDGFVNNHDTLTLSPLLLETYLDIAEQALKLALEARDGIRPPSTTTHTPVTLPLATLRQYVGDYSLMGTLAHVRMHHQRLQLQVLDHTLELVPESATEFDIAS